MSVGVAGEGGAGVERVGAPPAWPARDPRGHKGTFGTVGVVGGCCEGWTRMVGAPALAAVGALRVGAGRARIIAPEPIVPAALAVAPSAVGIAVPTGPEGVVEPSTQAAAVDAALAACDALVIGPGMGLSGATSAGVLRAVQQEGVPVVVDADALTALAALPEPLRDFRAPAVLTPHPGEFRRLAAALGMSAEIRSDTERLAGAVDLARRLGCVVALKGAGTVVTDGHRAWVCGVSDPVLATAGTGDVLAGVIAGIAAQFVALVEARPFPMPPVPAPPGRPLGLFEAACLGVAVHARAAEVWRARTGAAFGMLATELADALPAAAESFRGAGASGPAGRA